MRVGQSRTRFGAAGASTATHYNATGDFPMAVDLKSINIRGFKSLKNVEDFELRPLNVPVGARSFGNSASRAHYARA
jgi:hypothetical protein